METSAIGEVPRAGFQTEPQVKKVETQKNPAARQGENKQVKLTEETKKAIQELVREFSSNKQIKMDFDDSIGRVVITVIDQGTEQVVRQIPTPEMIAYLRRFTEYLGLFVERKV
jgi:flagellar protein FlaG